MTTSRNSPGPPSTPPTPTTSSRRLHSHPLPSLAAQGRDPSRGRDQHPVHHALPPSAGPLLQEGIPGRGLRTVTISISISNSRSWTNTLEAQQPTLLNSYQAKKEQKIDIKEFGTWDDVVYTDSICRLAEPGQLPREGPEDHHRSTELRDREVEPGLRGGAAGAAVGEVPVYRRESVPHEDEADQRQALRSDRIRLVSHSLPYP